LITLFGNLESGNVHKVQLILRYAGEPYRRVDMSQTRDETRRPEFLDLNPIGKIPAVRLDDGDVLSESNAILFYFARATNLWPEARRDQAEVLRWMFFEQYSHEPAVSVIRYLSRYTDDPRQHTDKIAELRPKAHRALEAMDALLQNRTWVAGDHCSIADYALYPYTRVADEADFDLAGYPSIQNWLSRVEDQPRFLPMQTDGAAETIAFSEYFAAGNT
jgi:glutathione S-transferase